MSRFLLIYFCPLKIIFCTQKSYYSNFNYFLHLFLFFKEIIDKYKGDNGGGLWGPKCPEIIKKNILNDNRLNKKDICIQSMLYLSAISSIKDITLIEAGCKYFYYWISCNLKEINNIQYIQNIYDSYMYIFKTYTIGNIEHVCASYNHNIIDEDLDILKALQHMHQKINYEDLISDDNNATKNQDFYNATSQFIEKYNNKLELLMDVNSKILLPPEPVVINNCRSNILTPIIITVVVTILISILLFICFKFTKIGSRLIPSILKKRYEWNMVDNDRNKMQSFEVPRNILSDKTYNVLYNFD
ncbi:variable surface protein [Plasmodium gonderi]|uniref:Variable surface protein n=1 Tax=Plasmodium gonderi TaxID=77519 RepID=A0A1Y1JSZ4_PLAGO|nr:variable surface protein [Plasmodium gonderi]GAW84257.1 variable surface protein [Plasmodium gonderi]